MSNPLTENYVDFVIEEFTQEEPTQELVDTICDQVVNQGRAIEDVVQELFQSDDYQGIAAPLARLYLGVLDRRADGPGLQFWYGEQVDVFAQEGLDSLTLTAQAFLLSAEAEALFGGPILEAGAEEGETVISDEEFVRQLYINVLDRDPDQDQEGLNFWLNELQNNPRFQGRRDLLTLAFTESPENVANTELDVQSTILHIALLSDTLSTEEDPYVPTDEQIQDYQVVLDAPAFSEDFVLELFITGRLGIYNSLDPEFPAPIDDVPDTTPPVVALDPTAAVLDPAVVANDDVVSAITATDNESAVTAIAITAGNEDGDMDGTSAFGIVNDQVVVTDADELEDGETFDLTITATSEGGDGTAALTINVDADVDTTPPELDLAPTTRVLIDGAFDDGALVTTITAADDESGIATLAITAGNVNTDGDDVEAFGIVDNQVVVTDADDLALDDSIPLTITATNGVGLTDDAVVTVNVEEAGAFVPVVLNGQADVTADDNAAEAFIYEVVNDGGVFTTPANADTVTITGFDLANDILRIDDPDTDTTTQLTLQELEDDFGVNVITTPFGPIQINLAPNTDQETSSITLAGITGTGANADAVVVEIV